MLLVPHAHTYSHSGPRLARTRPAPSLPPTSCLCARTLRTIVQVHDTGHVGFYVHGVAEKAADDDLRAEPSHDARGPQHNGRPPLDRVIREPVKWWLDDAAQGRWTWAWMVLGVAYMYARWGKKPERTRHAPRTHGYSTATQDLCLSDITPPLSSSMSAEIGAAMGIIGSRGQSVTLNPLSGSISSFSLKARKFAKSTLHTVRRAAVDRHGRCEGWDTWRAHVGGGHFIDEHLWRVSEVLVGHRVILTPDFSVGVRLWYEADVRAVFLGGL